MGERYAEMQGYTVLLMSLNKTIFHENNTLMKYYHRNKVSNLYEESSYQGSDVSICGLNHEALFELKIPLTHRVLGWKMSTH
jgi:hypothetical protein